MSEMGSYKGLNKLRWKQRWREITHEFSEKTNIPVDDIRYYVPDWFADNEKELRAKIKTFSEHLYMDKGIRKVYKEKGINIKKVK